jgi:hypothetical protein
MIHNEDVFFGNRIFVGVGAPKPNAIGVDPIQSLGRGPNGPWPASVSGSAYFEGPVHIGNGAAYVSPEACVQIARCTNINAPTAVPSILKVTSRLTPPTPLDVVIGDIVGPVGVSVNSIGMNIISPYINILGIINAVGIKIMTGAEIIAAIKAQAGVEARVGAKSVAGTQVFSGNVTVGGVHAVGGNATVSGTHYASKYIGDISACTGKKDFDIPHPTKDGWRLRHVCVEGPSADVYVRGKLENKTEIELPEYWKGLVDPESITVNLTPIGVYQELFVERIVWGRKIIVKNNSGGPIKCNYTIYGERIDCEKNIPEYEGTYEDYPGDNSQYTNSAIVLKRGES